MTPYGNVPNIHHIGIMDDFRQVLIVQKNNYYENAFAYGW